MVCSGNNTHSKVYRHSEEPFATSASQVPIWTADPTSDNHIYLFLFEVECIVPLISRAELLFLTHLLIKKKAYDCSSE